MRMTVGPLVAFSRVGVIVTEEVRQLVMNDLYELLAR